MLGWAARLFTKERDLRMVWRIAKDRRQSALVGTAHFFPYRFRAAMRRVIAGADTVLLEGPLDDESRRKVVAAGSVRRGASLIDALDSATLRRINGALNAPLPSSDRAPLYWPVLRDAAPDNFSDRIRPLAPWMAFFHIWTEFRRRDGWIYSMDLDAARIAAGSGREVRHLETIEEQIATLERIPLARMADFLKNVDWESYRRDYVRHYLGGDIAALMDMARAFPTFCEPVIEARDPVLLERMVPFLERGNAVAFVGITHCGGLAALLRARGYAVTGPR